MNELTIGESLERTLCLLRDIQQKCRIAQQEEEEANNETQDILHMTENMPEIMDGMGDVISIALQETRRKRRKAKNIYATTKSVVEWCERNKRELCELERILGAVRHMEEKQKNWEYTPRTEIARRIRAAYYDRQGLDLYLEEAQ